MNEELQKKLIELCDSLGTTVDHLWGVMIKQAYINGITTLVCVLTGVAICLIVSGFIVKYMILPAIKKGEDYYDSEIEVFGGCGLLALFILLMVVIAGSYVGDIVTSFANPEYWALMQLKF